MSAEDGRAIAETDLAVAEEKLRLLKRDYDDLARTMREVINYLQSPLKTPYERDLIKRAEALLKGKQ